MLKTKVCCVIVFALIDSLWVQALPLSATSDKNPTNYNNGRFKALECPENEFLNDEGKACEPTCENPSRPDVCKKQKVINCECDDGYVRNATGACIKPEDCPFQLPPKSENTLSVPRSIKHSGEIVNVVESNTTELYDNDAVVETSTVPRTTEDFDPDGLGDNHYTINEWEIDPVIIDLLYKEHMKMREFHVNEHRPDQSKTEEEREGEIKAMIRKNYKEIHDLDNIDYSYDNNADSRIDLEDWNPVIYK